VSFEVLPSRVAFTKAADLPHEVLPSGRRSGLVVERTQRVGLLELRPKIGGFRTKRTATRSLRRGPGGRLTCVGAQILPKLVVFQRPPDLGLGEFDPIGVFEPKVFRTSAVAVRSATIPVSAQAPLRRSLG